MVENQTFATAVPGLRRDLIAAIEDKGCKTRDGNAAETIQMKPFFSAFCPLLDIHLIECRLET
jgi:hypothetical protein